MNLHRSGAGTAGFVRAFLTTCLVGFVLGMVSSHFVINTTPSDRLGLYWYSALPRERAVPRGTRVYLVPPRWVKDELRRVAPPYLPIERPWMKTVAGVPGDTVCMQGDAVTINGVLWAARPLLREYDLTAPEGCVELLGQRYFVLNKHLHSFDSRYVGAFLRTDIRGTLTPLYTWEGTR